MTMTTMKTDYHTIDGATFSATDATDLMTKLRQDSFNPEADLPSYCRATARAAGLQRPRSAPATGGMSAAATALAASKAAAAARR